jgi:imidazolonepropionase-like amidohydrolase
LRAVTSVPAKLLGVSDRFGIIASGRQANLVALDGEPVAPGSRVAMVFIKGSMVYRRS